MLNAPKVNRVTQWMIRCSGRSWWQVRYASGKIISEWETLQFTKLFSPLGPAPTSRWEDIPKLGIRGLYLLCPNGKACALEADGEYAFFQLKVGFFDFGAGYGPKGFLIRFLPQQNRVCRAHVIGKVDSDDGHCVCYAWETETKKLIRFEDNVTKMAFENIGAISLGQHTGIQ